MYSHTIENEDFYELLEISSDSTKEEIRKAYRNKALKVHPDKNPNNPSATREFQNLSKIFDILTNDIARNTYDRALKERKQRKESPAHEIPLIEILRRVLEEECRQFCNERGAVEERCLKIMTLIIYIEALSNNFWQHS